MNRRGFIRSALAAAFGAAAGALLPKTKPQEVTKVFNAVSGAVFKEITWIEDEYCPDDIIYFVNRDTMKKWKLKV